MNPLGSSIPVRRVAAARELLASARTYYVSTTGNDNNNGMSPSAPFLTIQKAVDVVCGTVDMGPYQVTIQLADGTYTTGVSLKQYAGVLPPIISGNSSTPANTVISTTNDSAISALGPFYWIVKNTKLATTTSGHCVLVSNKAHIDLYNMDFGVCADYHVHTDSLSLVNLKSSYAISGSAKRHLSGTNKSEIFSANLSVVITNSPAFSNAFVASYLGALITFTGATFTGSATGVRYNGSYNSIIYTNGGGASYFPGNSAGSVSNGTLYA